jgi:hypothetical protein
VSRELNTIDPRRREIELRADSSKDGRPRQIAVRLPRLRGVLPPVWEVVVFTAFNVQSATVDLWRHWDECTQLTADGPVAPTTKEDRQA